MLTDNGQGLLGMFYQYDALHRIKQAQGYAFNGCWSSTSDYSMTASFDANGNIDALTRQGPSGVSDYFTYAYDPAFPNRLSHISGTSTLRSLPSQSSGNYTYDEIGNLIADGSESTAMTDTVMANRRMCSW